MLWHVGVRYGILVCLFAVDCPLFCLYLYVFRNIIYINLGRPQYPLVPIAATACAIWTSVESIASVGVSLNKKTLQMVVGNTATLTASVLPANASNKSVTWTSSNTATATISSTGTISAKAEGYYYYMQNG